MRLAIAQARYLHLLGSLPTVRFPAAQFSAHETRDQLLAIPSLNSDKAPIVNFCSRRSALEAIRVHDESVERLTETNSRTKTINAGIVLLALVLPIEGTSARLLGDDPPTVIESAPIQLSDQQSKASSSSLSEYAPTRAPNDQLTADSAPKELGDSSRHNQIAIQSPTERELTRARLRKKRTNNSAYHVSKNRDLSGQVKQEQGTGSNSETPSGSIDSLIVEELRGFPWAELPNTARGESGYGESGQVNASKSNSPESLPTDRGPTPEQLANEKIESIDLRSRESVAGNSADLLTSIGVQRRSQSELQIVETHPPHFGAEQLPKFTGLQESPEENGSTRTRAASTRNGLFYKEPTVAQLARDLVLPSRQEVASVDAAMSSSFASEGPSDAKVITAASESEELAGPSIGSQVRALNPPHSSRFTESKVRSFGVEPRKPQIEHQPLRYPKSTFVVTDLPSKPIGNSGIKNTVMNRLGGARLPASSIAHSCDCIPGRCVGNFEPSETYGCKCSKCSGCSHRLFQRVRDLKEQLLARSLAAGDMPSHHAYQSAEHYYYDRPYNVAHVEQVSSEFIADRIAPYDTKVFQAIHSRVEEGFSSESEVLLADGYLEFADWGEHKKARRNWEQLDHSEAEERIQAFENHVKRSLHQDSQIRNSPNR